MPHNVWPHGAVADLREIGRPRGRDYRGGNLPNQSPAAPAMRYSGVLYAVFYTFDADIFGLASITIIFSCPTFPIFFNILSTLLMSETV